MDITVSTTIFADPICRACARKLSHVKNKLNELKYKFLSVKQKLESSHGKASMQRQVNQLKLAPENPYLHSILICTENEALFFSPFYINDFVVIVYNYLRVVFWLAFLLCTGVEYMGQMQTGMLSHILA